jgi:hypothetical protein
MAEDQITPMYTVQWGLEMTSNSCFTAETELKVHAHLALAKSSNYKLGPLNCSILC